jgi:hypothetical protein
VRKCRPVSQRSPRRTVSVAATRNGASGPPTDARPLSGPVRVARSARVLRPGPPPIPERDPGPYVAPSPGFYPPPLVRPQLTRLRPRHKHDKRRVETPSMKSGPPPSAASIIPAIKSEPPPSIKSGPSPSTASSTAPSLAAPATQAPRDQTRPAVFAPRGRARIDPGLKSGPNHVAFKGDAARKLAAQFASACRNAHRIVAECPCLAGQGVASPQSSTGYPAF